MIFSLVITIALVGFVVWVVLQIPMPEVFRNLIIGVVALALVLWILQTLGINVHLPLVRL